MAPGFHQPVCLLSVLERQDGLDDRSDLAGSDQRPHLHANGGDDGRLLLDRPGPQRRGMHAASLAHERVEIDLGADAALQPDDRQAG